LLAFRAMNRWMKTMISFFKPRAVRLILLPWAALFLVLSLANTQDGGLNASSRFITMRAMGEEGTFRIDKRIGASSDWARTPDGHYYSNKAPGPMLLGFPVFIVMDQVPRLWEKGFRDEHGHRHAPGYFTKTWVSYLNQVLPLLILMALILSWLDRRGASPAAMIFFSIAALFGSTVSMYLNNYSGHGFEAVMQLGALFALLTGSFAWSGFFAGAALLSDYGFGVQIPAYVVALALSMRHHRSFWPALSRLVAGAVIPAVLWIWYHTAAFGGPFSIANHFQNPDYLDTAHEEKNLWGIFRLPNFEILMESLVRPTRGLLYTQPWILLFPPVILFSWWSGRGDPDSDDSFARKTVSIFCVLSLVALLFMNVSYGGWHGGGAPGPRYISGIFLCFALWAALEFDRFPAWSRWVFVALLGVAVVFRGMVYGSTILGPTMPLWNWYFEEFFKASKTPLLRGAIYVILFVGVAFWQKRLLARWGSERA
jgi:hypothetical protein